VVNFRDADTFIFHCRENILLGADGHVCVTDFGLAKDFSTVGGFDDEENRALTICGTQGTFKCHESSVFEICLKN
jgi:hypothetical protein